MTNTLGEVSRLLHEAGETHHRVFRVVDGADDDWARWYADWLANLSELPTFLDAKPVRSGLTYLLVSLDKEYTASQPGPSWEDFYAERIISHFSTLETGSTLRTHRPAATVSLPSTHSSSRIPACG